ncbi:MAG TPA: TIGR02300 family protein [Pseudolabrys sp.]|nr:TIGR02300 family protein [Pseudolabrys sp.]
MAKPELGTKRLCANCGAKFYDLSKSPIVCPKCETVFVVPVATSRPRPEAAAPRPAPKEEPVTVAPETADAEFVSLEDAEAEQQGKKTKTGDAPAEAAEGEEDVEIGESLDDAAFIQEEEEGDADVTDIIGEGIEKEEEP